MASGPQPPDPGPPGLQRDWTFVRSRPNLVARLSRLKSRLTGRRAPPPHRALKPVEPRARWNAYFAYLPDARLTPGHLFTIERLRRLDGGLLIVCATPRPADVPDELRGAADALYWKGLSGYDFSAYALALRAIAARSPGADVFVMNDSVLGPLVDPAPMLDRAPWDLTGFTASSALENHLQSYAFLLRRVTSERIAAFGSALPERIAYDRFRDVLNLQETRFARLAARRMSVGAFWYADAARVGDPSLAAAATLLEAGFPFLKKSLLGRYAAFQDEARLREMLAAHGHPL
jgi:lipopolysaccharide biosynthesis protein